MGRAVDHVPPRDVAASAGHRAAAGLARHSFGNLK